MGMGSSYASGGGLVQKQDSYVPLLKTSIDRSRLAAESGIAEREMALKERMYDERTGMGSRRSSGGRSSSDREMERRRQRLADQRTEQERQDEWSRKNQYMAGHHGREPTPEELADMQYEQESKEGGLVREEKGRQFDEKQALARSEGALDRESRRTEKGTGLKEREDIRRGEKHRRKMTAADMELDKEAKTQEHSDMMKAAFMEDYPAVEDWFKRNSPPDKQGSLDNPMFEAADEPDMVWAKFPGKDKQLMPKKALETLLVKLGSGYGEKPEKPTSEKDAARAASEYAKNASAGNPDEYQGLYREEYERLRGGKAEVAGGDIQKTRGGNFKQKAASLLKQIQETTGQKIIRARNNPKTGEIELTFEGGRKEIVQVD